MDEAIELEIEGRSPYPKKAAFIDAETPWTEQQMRRSAKRGYAIVLVWATATPGSSRRNRFSAASRQLADVATA